jgi:hypothetical protein
VNGHNSLVMYTIVSYNLASNKEEHKMKVLLTNLMAITTISDEISAKMFAELKICPSKLANALLVTDCQNFAQQSPFLLAAPTMLRTFLIRLQSGNLVVRTNGINLFCETAFVEACKKLPEKSVIDDILNENNLRFKENPWCSSINRKNVCKIVSAITIAVLKLDISDAAKKFTLDIYTNVFYFFLDIYVSNPK